MPMQHRNTDAKTLGSAVFRENDKQSQANGAGSVAG
jgi:hypothetical protein